MPAALAEFPDPEIPFVLNTGGLLHLWHGGTVETRVERVLALASLLEVGIDPSDVRPPRDCSEFLDLLGL